MIATLRRTSPALVAAALFALVFATSAAAFTLRGPQVAFQTAALQTYLNGVDGGINVATAQLDAQWFHTGTSANADFTLMAKLTGSANQNTIGLYNANDAAMPPTLFPIFPAAAVAGSRVICTFKTTGALIVSSFDENGNFTGQTTYAGVDYAHFCFYLQNNGGIYYQQDARNGGSAQALTYQGTGVNALDLWLAMEDAPYAAGTSTFTGAVIDLQSIVPGIVPVRNSSWGQLKATYR